jgi:Na+/proline symporter
MQAAFQAVALGTLLVGPFVYALWRSRKGTLSDYVFNSGRTGLLGTVAGIVCGNIGIGTFVALVLFSAASPVIGLSLALAYGVGLMICALVAPRVHRLSQRHGVRGLVDLIVVTHKVRHPLLVWAPIAFVFLLRASVQLVALAAMMTTILSVSPTMAVVLATFFAGAYTAIGGYRVATETDVPQALVVLAGIAALGLANIGALPAGPAFLDLGPYRFPILIGIWLFIPVSAVLAVDNWQRMATAQDPEVARSAFLIGAVLCLAGYLVIVWLGLRNPQGGDVVAILHSSVPPAWVWMVDLMLIAVVMSTMDTFVMPLVTGLERANVSLARIRLAVALLFLLLGLAAALLGDVLNSIIAAFSSLAVFLPVVWAAVRDRGVSAAAAIVSLNAGIAVTLVLTTVDMNSAALWGCLLSFLLYQVVSRYFPGRVYGDQRVGKSAAGG